MDSRLNQLIEWCSEFEIEASEEKLTRCLYHLDLVIEKNKKINLTRIVNEDEAVVLHILDSLLLLNNLNDSLDERFPACENISVDYAIMEKAEEIFVCPSDFGWSDLGTWGSLLTQTKHDADGNSVIGQNVALFETKNCIVHAADCKQVVVQGLDGYIVAEKDGRLLVCKISEEQRIKLFSEMKK